MYLRNYKLNEKIFSKLIEHYYNNLNICYFDIGARASSLGQLKRVKKRLKYIGFEIDKDEAHTLNERSKFSVCDEKYYPYGLWSENKEMDLFITKDQACSSLYEPNLNLASSYFYSPNLAYERTEKINVVSLDYLKDVENLVPPDIIKIDVQGAELQILKGANRFLNSAIAIQTEVEFDHVYKHQPLFADVDSYLRQNGFDLININRVYLKEDKFLKYGFRGRLLWGDAIYFKRKEFILDQLLESKKMETDLLTVLLVTSFFLNGDIGMSILNNLLKIRENQFLLKLKEIIFAELDKIPEKEPLFERISNKMNILNRIAKLNRNEAQLIPIHL